jgi:2-haloacid dehalogenase
MSEVEKRVNALLDSGRAYTIWFEQLMQYCFVDNCVGKFNDFGSIAKATMQMTAFRLGRKIDDDDIDFIMELLKQLPVHDGVPEGLSELNDLGYRLAALTNSPARVVSERMEPTGLISYFEKVLSAEEIKKYKPCTEVYQWAARKLSVATNECMLVSAHGWDIAGGAYAGMQTAFLSRGRKMLYPLAPKPNLVCSSLQQLAEQLSGVERESW